MPSIASGYAFAIFACLTNGSFLVPFKLNSIMVLKIPPIIFQLYASIGIFISSWLSAMFLPVNPDFVTGAGKSLVFVPFGFLGGVIMVLSMTFGFMATRKIGVALAQGIFGGLAIIVSYIWAVAIFGEVPSSIGLSISGIALLVIGISGIAASRDVAKYMLTKLESIAGSQAGSDVEGQSVHSVTSENHFTMSMESDGNRENSEKDRLTHFTQPRTNSTDYVAGVIYALLCGALGGTTLVPLHYVEAAHGGLAFIPSFGTGVLVTTPFVMLFYYYIIERKPLPPIPLDRGLVAGIVSGVVWNVSNILSVGAIPVLGYGVAFPLVHSAILISGLWGILKFREFDDLPFAEAVFFICGGFIIAGAAMITVGA